MAGDVNPAAAGPAPAGPTLVVNVGGATLALSLVAADGSRLATTTVDPWDGGDRRPLRDFLADRPVPMAVGHRVVHGGDLDQPVVIDGAVLDAIRAAGALSPVHQERALTGIAAAGDELPSIPQVACFDTTFHRTIPDRAAVYALPAEWRDRWPLRRRGFHGLSHGYVAEVAPTLFPDDRTGPTGDQAGRPVARLVSCHLGSGVSLCAIEHGRSIDTTMGATPLDGLVMARRSGSVDPGVLLWLLDEGGLDRRRGPPGVVGRGRSGRAGRRVGRPA